MKKKNKHAEYSFEKLKNEIKDKEARTAHLKVELDTIGGNQGDILCPDPYRPTGEESVEETN